MRIHLFFFSPLMIFSLFFPSLIVSHPYLAMNQKNAPYEKKVYGTAQAPKRSVAEKKARSRKYYTYNREKQGRNYQDYSLKDERFNPNEYEVSGRKKRQKPEQSFVENDRFLGEMDENGRRVREAPIVEEVLQEDRFLTDLDESGRVLRDEDEDDSEGVFSEEYEEYDEEDSSEALEE